MSENSNITPLTMDLKQAALHCSCSVKTLRRAIAAGKLQAIKATAKITVMTDDVRRYLEAHKIMPS